MEDIWSNQPLLDVIYLGVGICFLFGLLTLMLVPGILGMISYMTSTSKGEDIVSTYIKRFFPYELYVGIVELFNLTCNTTLVLSALHFGDYLLQDQMSHLEAINLFLKITLAQLGINFVQYLISTLWRVTFGGHQPLQLLLGQDILSINLLLGLLKLVLLSMVLSGLWFELSLWMIGIVLALGFLLRTWRSVVHLSFESNSYIYIFLYLCTCEILPYLYFLMGYAYLTNKELLDKLH